MTARSRHRASLDRLGRWCCAALVAGTLVSCGSDPGPALGVRVNVAGLDGYDCSTTVSVGANSATYKFPTTDALRLTDPPPPQVPSRVDCTTNGASNAVDVPCDESGQPAATVCRRHDSCVDLQFWTSTGDVPHLETALGGSTFSASVQCGGTTIFAASNLMPNEGL